MANILLVDPAEIARKAMSGIVARGGHRFAAVSGVQQALQFMRDNIPVDLVFLEVKLDGPDGGFTMLQKLREDPFLKLVPVVIYAAAGDRDTVRQALALGIQNFLMKPYRDQTIFAEIAKAIANPWRARHFEEEKSFCKMMGLTPEALHAALEQLLQGLQKVKTDWAQLAQDGKSGDIIASQLQLSADAEACGAWGVVELLSDLHDQAENRQWPSFLTRLPLLDFAERLIFTHLHPDLVTEGFVSEAERNQAAEARARAFWFDAAAEGRCPVVSWKQLLQAIENLAGCPVIDSVAAEFQMSATGRPSSLAPLMDLAETDPGLCTHLLVAATKLRHGNADLDSEPVEDPRICVNLLGETKLAAMASGLITAEARMMNAPPCSWTQFWMFQVGVARMSRYICRYLEFNSLQSRAYAAGLLHDLGKLLLLHLQPVGFLAILDYARQQEVPLAAAEQKFLGGTTREMATYFAEKHGLPRCYVHVMQWVDKPTEATDDVVLVAVVALAHELCRANGVGWSGDAMKDQVRAIAETPAWSILRERIFPSFDLAKFEAEAHAKSRELRDALRGEAAA